MKKIFFILVFLGFGCVSGFSDSVSDHRSAEEIFLSSKGGSALKAKQYHEALSEIERLMEIRKNDPYLHKMKGFLLYQTGQRKESEKFFKKAIELNPLDRQSHFYLAQLNMKSQKKEKAKEHLQFIVDHPDEYGYYDEKAQRALGVIETAQVEKPTAKEKKWKLYGAYGFDYDDNVPLQSQVNGFKTKTDRNANRLSLRNGATYDYYRDPSKKLGVGYTFSQTLHDDNVEEFNYRNHIVQKYGTYFTEIADHTVAMGLKYTFSHGILDTHTFSSTNALLSWFSFGLTENLLMSLYDNLSHINFRNKGFDEGISSRDGWYNTVGIMNTLYFSGRKRSISLGYESGYNQTEGDNFDARVHAVRTSFKSHLIEKIQGEVQLSFVNDNHYNFATLPHRHDLTYEVTSRLIRPIGKYWELRLQYTFRKNKQVHAGLLGQYEYTRHIAGGELSFSY